MKKLLSVILTITILMSVSSFALAEEKVLKVAISADFPPFEYYENNELTGFDIELMNYLAGGLGYKVEYFNCEFDAVFVSVMSGQSDCAISAISITEERKKNMYFTEPYIANITDSSAEKFGIASNNSELCELFNIQLESAKNTGVVSKLLEKYELSGTYFPFYPLIDPLGINGVPSAWARDSVDEAFRAGITEGKDYVFQNPITREEFCEMIYNLVLSVNGEISAIHPENITDTDNRKMLVLSGLGIISGKSETELAPMDFLTREEAATIIIRMINKFMQMASTSMWFEYDDIDKISDWASDSVQAISNLGFMQGTGDNKFAPDDTYTIEQAITTLVRVYKAAKLNEEIYNQINITNTIEINDFYIDEAIKLVTESGKLAGDKDFISLYTTSEEMTNKILPLGEVDFGNPEEMYYMSADREQIMNNIKKIYTEEENFDIEKLDDFIFEKLWRKMNFSSLAGLINASYGSENLAALTILTNSRGYIMPKDFKNDFALFIKYEGDYSAIVAFSEYGDGVISAYMSFVKNGNKDNVFRRLDEIISALGEESIIIAKVK